MGKLNFPRKHFIGITDFHVIPLYDYVDFFKNIRDNWMPDQNKVLLLTEDGSIYVAPWCKFEVFHKDGCKNTIHLSKIAYA